MNDHGKEHQYSVGSNKWLTKAKCRLREWSQREGPPTPEHNPTCCREREREHRYTQWTGDQRRPDRFITHLSTSLPASFVVKVNALLSFVVPMAVVSILNWLIGRQLQRLSQQALLHHSRSPLASSDATEPARARSLRHGVAVLREWFPLLNRVLYIPGGSMPVMGKKATSLHHTVYLKVQSLIRIQFSFCLIQQISPPSPPALRSESTLKTTPALIHNPGSVHFKQTKSIGRSNTLVQPINNIASGAVKGGVYLIVCSTII